MIMCDLIECQNCRHKCNYDNSDKETETMWNELTDIPFDDVNGQLILSDNWNGWKKGTEREIIWKWFDEHHSKGVAYLLYEYSEK